MRPNILTTYQFTQGFFQHRVPQSATENKSLIFNDLIISNQYGVNVRVFEPDTN